MILQYFHKIPRFNEQLLSRFRTHPKANQMDWAVTELVDGDHMALYADAKTNTFRIASRNRFMSDIDNYSCSNDVIHLYKDWIMDFSKDEKNPIITYGRAVGGNYNGKSISNPIKTVCEYLEYTDYIIHDIKVPDGFLGMEDLEDIATNHGLVTAPVLWHGPLWKAVGHPENNLSAIPFMHGLDVNYYNEMKGIVIKPVHHLISGSERLIIKKLNKKYIGQYIPRKPVELTPDLANIAMYMFALGTPVVSLIEARKGTMFGAAEVRKLAGQQARSCLAKSYIKYTLITKEEQHLVNKEINRIAEENIYAYIKYGSAA